jgi:uncharacterized protein (DUF952 family)
MANQPITDIPTTGRVLVLTECRIWDRTVVEGVYRETSRGKVVVAGSIVYACTVGQLPMIMVFIYGHLLPRDCVLLVIDLPILAEHGIELRWENHGDAVEAWPHIYGDVPLDAIVASLPLEEVTIEGLFALDVIQKPPPLVEPEDQDRPYAWSSLDEDHIPSSGSNR